jgi:asparagine synthase (glutamine-hydrolysing)
MCGIAGYLTDTGVAISGERLLETMCDQLRHRGPDDFGYWTDAEAGLGHRRLSIIDVAGGKQPLCNEDGTVWVTCNGEIYNYRDLRRQLIDSGHSFRTHSDTEVLVHLYEEVGERLPELLRGMFAFAIWDSRHRDLFLARDRFGEKPLYYSASIPGFQCCFASEIKALTVLLGFDARVDVTAFADYLALSYVPDPKSIFTSVRKLPPGHSLVVSQGKSRLRRYWEPPFAETRQANFPRAVTGLRELAEEAVREQSMSEVPLGAFLSGGVDSTAVTGILAEQLGDAVRTFSIGFTEESHDELRYARLAAARHRTQHREQVLSSSIAEILPLLAWHYDEPFADSSAIPALYLARLARAHVTVALSGDGADEVFAGYRQYSSCAWEERIRRLLPKGIRAGSYFPSTPPRRFGARLQALLANALSSPADAHFNAMSAFRDASLHAILSPGIRAKLYDYDPRTLYRDKFAAVRHLPPQEQMQWLEMTTSLPGDMLVKMDRATMAFSLESRAPWLDHRIAEFAGSLPFGFKVRGSRRKVVLKSAVANVLPEEIVHRPKMGFSVPLAKWLRSGLQPAFEEFVLTPSAAEYFDPDEVRRLWQEHQAGRYDHGRKLWTVLVFMMWTRQWLRQR